MESQQIGQYVLEERLGAGGMAEVWKARNTVLGNQVAIKFLNRQFAGDPEIEQRFLGEGKRQANLQHPSIVSAFDFLYIEGRSYLVMRYVKGENLEDRLIRLRAALPLPAVLSISRDVLDALDYAHSEQIVHRDIKPSNILLENNGRALVMDFGIAVVLGEQRVTRAGVAIGTPHYMSPEQIVGAKEFDQRSDIYSYGCVLYQMLTERPPFDSVEGEGDTEYFVKHQHVLNPPRPLRESNPEIPEYIESAVLRCLEKRPADRFTSCRELLEALTTPPAENWGRAQTVMESPVPSALKGAWQTQIDRPAIAGPAVLPLVAPIAVNPRLTQAQPTIPPPTIVPPPVAPLPLQPVPAPSSKKPIIAIASAAFLLCASGGGYLWYRNQAAASTTPGTKSEPTKQSESTPAPEVHKAIPAPAPVLPPASSPSRKEQRKKEPAVAPNVAQGVKPKPIIPPSIPEPKSPTISQKDSFVPAPVAAANPQSGVLHCPGTPVSQGETVEFHNQPKGRVRYTVDRTAWRVFNKNGLDGTKTLVLESLKPGVQTSCTVNWEVVPQ